MKEFTIIKNYKNEIAVIKTADIYEVVYLNTIFDNSYILSDDGELHITDGYYPMNYFINNTERLVVKRTDVERYKLIVRGEYFAINWNGKSIEVLDVTKDWMAYSFGKAVKIPSGEIIFDADGDERFGDWWTIAEVDAIIKSTNNPMEKMYHCDNGWEIKELSYPNKNVMSEFEFID